MKRKRKAFAYITHGPRLLVFAHPTSPEAGIQVPAGTVREGESPENGVLREAREETGLQGLVLRKYLGRQDRDMRDFGRDEVHERYFYHVLCTEEPAEAWRHRENDPSDCADSIPFDFFWVPLPDGVPPLVADHDAKLPLLLEVLGLKEVSP
jgi:8-oxo-dGTP pyrophosphatase MutT (NUDIX family)